MVFIPFQPGQHLERKMLPLYPIPTNFSQLELHFVESVWVTVCDDRGVWRFCRDLVGYAVGQVLYEFLKPLAVIMKVIDYFWDVQACARRWVTKYFCKVCADYAELARLRRVMGDRCCLGEERIEEAYDRILDRLHCGSEFSYRSERMCVSASSSSCGLVFPPRFEAA